MLRMLSTVSDALMFAAFSLVAQVPFVLLSFLHQLVRQVRLPRGGEVLGGLT